MPGKHTKSSRTKRRRVHVVFKNEKHEYDKPVRIARRTGKIKGNLKRSDARKAAKKMVGRTYKFKAPTAYGSTTVTGHKNGVTITNKELLAQIPGAVTTGVASFICQPGNSTTHPWLYPMASMFESYKYVRLEFLYVARCASTTSGSVIGYYEYDVNDTAADTLADFAANSGAIETSPWNKSMRWRFNPRNLIRGAGRKDKFFTRVDDQTVDDLQNYDTCNFNLMATGQANSSIIGDLWVVYTIQFHTPQVAQNIPMGLFYALNPAGFSTFAQFTNFGEYSPCFKNEEQTGVIFHRPFKGTVFISISGSSIPSPGHGAWTFDTSTGCTFTDAFNVAQATGILQTLSLNAEQGAEFLFVKDADQALGTYLSGSVGFYPSLLDFIDATPIASVHNPIIGTHPRFTGASLVKYMRQNMFVRPDRISTHNLMRNSGNLMRNQVHQMVNSTEHGKEIEFKDLKNEIDKIDKKISISQDESSDEAKDEEFEKLIEDTSSYKSLRSKTSVGSHRVK